MTEIETNNNHRELHSSSSVSVIGEGTIYHGDVQFEGVLHINGDFYGNINGCGDLGIGYTGRVKSAIHANNVIVSGLVCGNIIAMGRVGIKSSAIVIGDIQASTLVIEEGAILQSKLKTLDSIEKKKLTATKSTLKQNSRNSNVPVTHESNGTSNSLAPQKELSKAIESPASTNNYSVLD